MVQHLRAQLMQPGEGQLHLRLHTGRPRHPAPVRPRSQVLQERALAYPRVTAHHQGTALTSPDSIDEPVKLITFGQPVRQLDRTASAVGARGHRPESGLRCRSDGSGVEGTDQ